MNIDSNSNPDPKHPVVLLFGPTAVGKTRLLAEVFSNTAEVINADSRQVYRRMDIGTAKPDRDITKDLPHHLIDIRDPNEQYTAGDFVHDADSLIPVIAGRGKIPIISGGTPFYFRNFLFGLPETPSGDPEIRKTVRHLIRDRGLDYAYRELGRVDPESAKRISTKDRYRIERALEVYRSSGRPLSAYRVPTAYREDYRMLLIGLERERQELYESINLRVDRMFEDGLPAEVKKLVSLGHDHDAPGLQGIGYREFFTMRRVGCTTYPDVKKLIARNSRRYAKRQMTFFKRFPDTVWLSPEAFGSIHSLVQEFLKTR